MNIINKSSIEHIRQIGGDELVIEIIDLFFDLVPAVMFEIEMACKNLDHNLISDLTHKLRSSCGNLGAYILNDAASELSRLAKEEDDKKIHPQFEIMQELFHDCVEDLECIKKDFGPVKKSVAASKNNNPDKPVVVFVEDNIDNRVLVNAILSDDYKVIEFDNGADGLCGIEKIIPDIVLLDISLPVMDGMEILKRIRKNPEISKLPVIALTAHAMAGDKERFLTAGFDGYHPKPVDERELQALIASFL